MAGGKKNKIVINKADFKKNPALMQVPVAIGSRKHTRLWFDEMDHGIRGR